MSNRYKNWQQSVNLLGRSNVAIPRAHGGNQLASFPVVSASEVIIAS
jgi:hypothetical protein